MTETFFFYDLETSGLNPRDDRIMQFAGQRTDANLQPIGKPYNLLVALGDDTLPSPHAIMVTGVTPQRTVEEGYSEADFCKIFADEIATPGTTMVGYNNVRFDDEFMRAVLWRNYYDPYEWTYKDGRSRWDLLDVVRMTRALRPEGINWPVVDGKPTNRLELLSAENGIDHVSAHDALSDVEALIGLADLIRSKQPQLFDYLYRLRDKKAVMELATLSEPKPFVYSSGRYDNEYEKTTVVYPVGEAEHGNIYVYDLRHDPSHWAGMSTAELRKHIETPYAKRDENYRKLPIKKLQYNRCPAVAPINVLGIGDAWQRIGLSQAVVDQNLKALQANAEFVQNAVHILSNLEKAYPPAPDAEGRLYDGFVGDRDRLRAEAVRSAATDELRDMQPKFDDERLVELWPRYKYRRAPRLVTGDERASYETYRRSRLERQAPEFLSSLQQLIQSPPEREDSEFLLDELRLWYESKVELD